MVVIELSIVLLLADVAVVELLVCWLTEKVGLALSAMTDENE